MFAWNAETEAKLKRLYIDESRSAGETARALGKGCTRSAVIGKAHRLGLMVAHRKDPALPGAPAPAKAPAVKRDRQAGAINARKGRAGSSTATKPVPVPLPAPANDTSIRLIDRHRLQCAWPLGVPSRPAEQMCCGAPVPEGASASVESYCTTHAAKAMSRAPSAPKPEAKAYERAMRRWAA